MCWNQGDWRFYHFYKQWQKRAAQVAREICGREKVDVLHQLNMVGFREPGYLWKVARETGVPFVWGPIGGLKRFPMRYAKGGGWKMQLFLRIKNAITTLQIRFGGRVHKALHTAETLFSTIPDSRDAILRYHGLESIVMPETGCWNTELVPVQRRTELPFRLLWVGKFDFRKRLDLALLTMARLKDLSVVLDVYGTGNEQQKTAAQSLVAELGIADKVHFMGSRPNEEVRRAMREADLFFFTSVSEDTSTVVPEAIDACLPVLCFDACGMSYVVDDTVGIKVPLTCPADSVETFALHIRHLAEHRDELLRMSQGCIERRRQLSWESKAEMLLAIYEKMTLSRI